MENQWIDLYRLIRSLTASEKGYFRKYIKGFSLKESSTYIELFNYLDKTSMPVSSEIIKKFTGKTKNLISIRIYLYGQILKSLRAYHSSRDIPFELRETLDNLEILNKKGLINQAMKMVKKGLKQSEETEMHAYNLIFLTHHKQLLNYYDESEKIHIANQIAEKIKINTRIILNRQIITDGYSRSIHLINSNQPLKNKTVKKEVESLLETLIDIPEETVLSNYSKNSLYAAQSLLNRLLGNFEKATMFQEKTIQLMEQLDLRKINRIPSYLSALFNLGNLYVFNNDYASASKLIGKMQTIKVEGHREELLLKALITQMELDILIFSHNFQDAEPTIENAEQFLKNEHPVPNIYYDSQLRLLSYYIYINKFDKAIEKSHLLMNTNYQHSQHSFQVHVRLLNLIVHYKSGNYLLLPSLLRSAYRLMNKKELSYEIEKLILKFFSRLLNMVDKKELHLEFMLLKDKLILASNDNEEAIALKIYFDYVWWLDKEIQHSN